MDCYIGQVALFAFTYSPIHPCTVWNVRDKSFQSLEIKCLFFSSVPDLAEMGVPTLPCRICAAKNPVDR
jgi:hypothetical protein